MEDYRVEVHGECRENIFTTKCPFGCFYEYINGYMVRTVGDITCKGCRFYRGSSKVINGTVSIRCSHDDSIDVIPQIISGR